MRSKTSSPAPQVGQSLIAWQGWLLQAPARWNPVRLEGDFDRGYALFADLHQPRLGIRWRKPDRKKFNVADWSQRALREEVGMLAAEEAKELTLPDAPFTGSKLYLDPKPPGRDVWVAYSPTSGRMVEVIYHARRRDRRLAETILPSLQDLPPGGTVPWSIFELSCRVPQGMGLERQQLIAGDLTLSFKHKAQVLSVRQVAVAELALQRMSLERWLANDQRRWRKHYRTSGPVTEGTVIAEDGRSLKGLSQRLRRRRRFFFMGWRPPQLITLALHDQRRDRLVFVEGSDEQTVAEVARTVGWASPHSAPASLEVEPSKALIREAEPPAEGVSRELLSSDERTE